MTPLFIKMFCLLLLSLSYVNWARDLFISPVVLTLVLRFSFVPFSRAFSFLCLLATAILASFFHSNYLTFPPSRDGRPNSLGIGVLRSLWLLPAELG